VFFCYHCYAASDHPVGAVCGKPVEQPAGLSRLDILIWELGHPDTQLAARALGRVDAPESVAALRAVIESAADIGLRAEALLSLISLEGPQARPWLEELSRAHPLPVGDCARQRLAERAASSPAPTSRTAAAAGSSASSAPTCPRRSRPIQRRRPAPPAGSPSPR